MLFNLTFARTLLSTRIASLTPLFFNSAQYSTMSHLPQSSHPPPPAVTPPNTLPNQGPPKLHLYTAGTPNGYKASTMLEELRAAYPDKALNELSYDVIPIRFSENDQKTEAYLKINPNGRIPALIDDNAGGQNIWESASILLWLSSQYDTEHKLSFADPKLNADMLSWIFFAHGGIGPMQGQAGVFLRNPVKIPFAIKRYVEETQRLYGVVEEGLKAGNGWLVGNKFSVADINAFTWMSGYPVGVDMSGFPHLKAWIDKISARQGIKNGLQVPQQRVVPEEEAWVAKRKEVEGYIDEANKELAAASKK